MPWSRFIIHIYSHENDELKNGKGPVKGPSAEGDHPRGTEKKPPNSHSGGFFSLI
jgi:hypothetical protein